MRPSVLVVEDETALLTLLRYNLEKEGFAVSAAHDGEEALLQLKESKPDAVLLDWMLPRVSGIEVCRQIRRTPAWKDLPVIMLTARGEEADRVRGLDSGADDYVVKPFSPNELIARLRAVIRRARPAHRSTHSPFGASHALSPSLVRRPPVGSRTRAHRQRPGDGREGREAGVAGHQHHAAVAGCVALRGARGLAEVWGPFMTAVTPIIS